MIFKYSKTTLGQDHSGRLLLQRGRRSRILVQNDVHLHSKKDLRSMWKQTARRFAAAATNAIARSSSCPLGDKTTNNTVILYSTCTSTEVRTIWRWSAVSQSNPFRDSKFIQVIKNKSKAVTLSHSSTGVLSGAAAFCAASRSRICSSTRHHSRTHCAALHTRCDHSLLSAPISALAAIGAALALNMRSTSTRTNREHYEYVMVNTLRVQWVVRDNAC